MIGTTFQYIRKVIWLFILSFGLTQIGYANEKYDKYKLILSAFKCNIASETIASSYLYIGEKIGARQARREQEKAIKIFEKNYSLLENSINDKKIKNLLTFINMSYSELKGLIKDPYGLDNAQIILDLTATISEGTRHIAELYKKKIEHNDPVNATGLSPMIESIAKYYIAYQAGIKDDNTVKLMNETVAFCNEEINTRVNYAKNTVEMNKTINKVKRLWGIVHQFYLDINEGGLPFIVFKTTAELKNHLTTYNNQYKALKEVQLKAKK